MIIVLLPTEQNLKASEQLKIDGRFGTKICPFHQITFSDIQDDSLTLLDMGAEGTLQDLLEPEILADKLCTKGLPQSIKAINIISSDLKSPISLYEFGSALAGILKDKYQRNIQVRVTSDIKNDIALVIPPLNHQEAWKIFGIEKSDTAAFNALNFNNLSSIDNKKLIWQGTDILQWLTDPQHICTSENAWRDPFKPF